MKVVYVPWIRSREARNLAAAVSTYLNGIHVDAVDADARIEEMRICADAAEMRIRDSLRLSQPMLGGEPSMA
jgi:hypothetical protein